MEAKFEPIWIMVIPLELFVYNINLHFLLAIEVVIGVLFDL